MSAIWRINGVTFDSLGLSGLRRELRTLAPDIVTFTSEGEPFDSADISGLALGNVVSITREIASVETQWFKGVVTRLPRQGDPAREARSYEITGPWYYLEQLVYQQRFPLNAGANPSVGSPSLSRRAVAVIGQNYLGQRETNIAALTDVLDWCIGAGAGFSRGTLPTGFNFPYVSAIAPTCAEAARACLKWMPDAASRFDYSATTPVLSVVRRGSASAVSVDLSAPPAAIADVSVTPRPDLKVDHVVIQRITVDGNSFFIYAEDKDPGTATGLEFGSLVIPIDDNTDPIPSGLAANWRSSLSTLQYQGRIRFVAEDCTGTVRPGDVLNLTNGLSAWATMNAQITGVNEDVDSGTTEWIFGPPAHLSVQDFVTLLRAARQQVTPYNGPPLVSGRRDPAISGQERSASSYLPTSQSITGDLAVSGNLDVGGITALQGTLSVYDNVFFDQSLEIQSNLDVGGITALQGTLSVYDNVFFDQSLDITGNLDVGGILAVQGTAAFYGNVAMDAALDVNTNLDVGGILAVQGTAAFYGNVAMDAALDVNTNLDVGGIMAVQGTAAFYSNVTMSAALDVDTTLTVGTSVIIGGSTLTRRTIQVCDGGVTKSMYVLGSATF